MGNERPRPTRMESEVRERCSMGRGMRIVEEERWFVARRDGRRSGWTTDDGRRAAGDGRRAGEGPGDATKGARRLEKGMRPQEKARCRRRGSHCAQQDTRHGEGGVEDEDAKGLAVSRRQCRVGLGGVGRSTGWSGCCDEKRRPRLCEDGWNGREFRAPGARASWDGSVPGGGPCVLPGWWACNKLIPSNTGWLVSARPLVMQAT